MPNISRSALVPYSCEQMYQLVDDITSYQDFLPWCGESIEHKRDDSMVEATVTIAKGSINKAFSTRNILQANEVIEMQLLDGPFKKLHGFWRFQPLQDTACKISLDLEFEFSNRLVGLAIGPIFNQVANTLVDSFVERAKSKYK
ncbi:MAG TPA: type II toxin-antitoxin system RatA family toxin [Leucothrix mucor]|nr:type II toxin-antitoxin system RatA family toxin [Leucothrix mucor]